MDFSKLPEKSVETVIVSTANGRHPTYFGRHPVFPIISYLY